MAEGNSPKERPILFSAPMVRAILDGRKTQTRRVVKGRWLSLVERVLEINGEWVWDTIEYELTTPFGRPDDRLWVRENFTVVPASAYRMSEGVQQTVNPNDPYEAAIYASGWDRSIPKWKPSIHMPRWASRITLEITGVRVERLQDISEADAIAEGIYNQPPSANDRDWYKSYCADRMEEPDWVNFEKGVWIAPGTRQGFGIAKADRERPQWGPTAAFAYRCLFEHINGPKSWEENPWVWVVEFRRIDANKAVAA